MGSSQTVWPFTCQGDAVLCAKFAFSHWALAGPTPFPSLLPRIFPPTWLREVLAPVQLFSNSVAESGGSRLEKVFPESYAARRNKS